MLQEQSEQKQQTYIYETGNYAPLGRIDTEYEVDDIYYYHTDQIGTPLELTNEQGTIVWQANYKAWGEVDSFSINKIEQNLRYQGQYFDEETELHYNTFRYYDPQIGRFTTQDPIGLRGGFNLYSYAPSSTGWIDPWGWCADPKARTNNYRNTLGGKPGGIGGDRNIASSNYDIDGLGQGTADAISGTASRKGFVDIPDPNNRLFQTKEVDGFSRAFDSEAKILENIGSKINGTPNVSGTINLHSELPICNSCSGVISQFREMFPNINVIVTSG